MLNRVTMLQACHPKKIFIMAGTNDLCHISLDEYRKRYDALINAIKDSLPYSKIYIESVLPSNHKMKSYAPNEKVQQANRIASELAKTHKCTYVNLYDLYADKENELPREMTKDGVHLYPQSYDRWANEIRKYIGK